MSDTDSDINKTPPRKKTKYRQTGKNFQDKWLEEFPWVGKIREEPNKAKCKLCNKILCAGRSELLKHQSSQIHQKSTRNFTHQQTINNFVKNASEDTHKENVKFAEMKLVLYFAEHNVAIQNIDHLVDLLKVIAPDSKIIKDMNLKRSKCTEILKNVLSEVETRKLVQRLQKTNFSIMVDESTDISVNKNLCVLVKYQNDEGRVETRLLEMIKMETQSCTAGSLYAAFKASLEEKKIPLKNIIGMASDGCNTMVGLHNSFYTHLKEDVPNVLLIPCICHSSAIIASKSCEELPRSVEELMRSTYNYVSSSSKRCKQLMEIQEFFKLEQKKILNVSATRWLSWHQCVVRYLENYDALKHYFLIAVAEDKLKSAEQILGGLNNICNRAYLYFLKFTLNFFNSFNALFQSREIKIHVLYEKCNALLKQICQNFLKMEIVLEKDLSTININNPSFFLPLHKIYLSSECETLVKTLPSSEAHNFRITCLNFYKKAVEEIQKRLPLKIDLYKEMKFLDLSLAFSDENFSLNALCAYFKEFIDANKLEIEWRNLQLVFHEGSLNEKDTESLWIKISQLKAIDDTPAFENISKLASLIMILPHSNAEAERIFSIVSDVKVRKRNRLGEEVLNSVCVVRSAIQDRKSSCVQYPITKDHYMLHNINMYSFKNQKNDISATK